MNERKVCRDELSPNSFMHKKLLGPKSIFSVSWRGRYLVTCIPQLYLKKNRLLHQRPNHPPFYNYIHIYISVRTSLYRCTQTQFRCGIINNSSPSRNEFITTASGNNLLHAATAASTQQ